MKIIFLLPIFVLLIISPCHSQKGTTTVGIQIKPIFPVSFLGTGKITNDVHQIHFETLLNSGFSGGLIIRHNFTNLLAFETGINYVKRKYSLKIKDNSLETSSDFRVISYEIPAVLMVYAQLGEKFYINGSMGPTIDMFASSIQVYNDYFNQLAFRNHIIQPTVSANAGFEYRTEKNGTLYLGASFQRPFSFIYLSKIAYYQKPDDVFVYNELSGSYLTIDFRYFFPLVQTKNVE